MNKVMREVLGAVGTVSIFGGFSLVVFVRLTGGF